MEEAESLCRGTFVAPRYLDEWLSGLYQTHRDGGNIGVVLVRMGVHVVIVLFVTSAATLVLCSDVEWPPSQDVVNVSDMITQFQVTMGTVMLWVGVLVYLGTRVVGWVKQVFRMQRMMNFCVRYDLNITEWSSIVNQLMVMQNDQGILIQVNKTPLTERDISMRILRREHYMVSMIKDGVIPVGDLSSVVEWHVWYVLLGPLMDRDGTLKLTASSVRRDATILMVCNIVALPLTLLMVFVHTIMRGAETWVRRPHRTTRAFRSWSRWAQWRMRHYNEYVHDLDERLNAAAAHAHQYMDTVPHPMLVVLARGVRYISGAIAGCIAFVATVEDEALSTIHAADKPLLWWLAFWTAVYTVAGYVKPARPGQMEVFKKMVRYTQYFPEDASTPRERTLAKLFPLIFTSSLHAMVTLVSMPYLLWRWRRDADHIVEYLRRQTTFGTEIGDYLTVSAMTHAIHTPPLSQSTGSFCAEYAEARQSLPF